MPLKFLKNLPFLGVLSNLKMIGEIKISELHLSFSFEFFLQFKSIFLFHRVSPITMMCKYQYPVFEMLKHLGMWAQEKTRAIWYKSVNFRRFFFFSPNKLPKN